MNCSGGNSCTKLQPFCCVVSKRFLMKNLKFSLVFQMTKCSSWRSGAFLFAFNHDIAIAFLFLWASEIWKKHNLLLRSSDNCSLSWLVVQPFVSLRHSLPLTLHPRCSSLTFFVFPCKTAIDKSSKENLIVAEKKGGKKEKKITSELQSSKLNFRHSLCVCAASELQRVGSGRGGYRRLADVWEWESSLKQLFTVSFCYIYSHDARSGRVTAYSLLHSQQWEGYFTHVLLTSLSMDSRVAYSNPFDLLEVYWGKRLLSFGHI